MINKRISSTKYNTFEVCTKALNKYDCEILSADFSSGIIEAKKSANLLSFGHEITILLKIIDRNNTEVVVSSKSIGVQIIDWGTNSKNEEELITLITNSLQ